MVLNFGGQEAKTISTKVFKYKLGTFCSSIRKASEKFVRETPSFSWNLTAAALPPHCIVHIILVVESGFQEKLKAKYFWSKYR